MRRKTMICLAVLLVLGFSASLALSAPTERWDFRRASLTVTAQAAIYEDSLGEVSSGFLPQVGVSYSLSRLISAIAAAERDWPNDVTIIRVGGRFAIVGTEAADRLHVFAGADYVSYADSGHLPIIDENSWAGSLNGAWTMLKQNDRDLVWLTASGSYDPENQLTIWRGGLRWQPWGGNP